jgi:hypothetical protein
LIHERHRHRRSTVSRHPPFERVHALFECHCASSDLAFNQESQ